MAREDVVSIETIREAIKKYYPDADLSLVNKAYQLADSAHHGQTRQSGEPYIIHPLHVAQTLADMRLDIASIVTGLLHDTVEDTSTTLETISKSFSTEIAELVDGVTKLSRITFQTSEEKQAENFRKMILAMAKDIRVILVKLADRLNNMQTLEHLADAKQKQVAQETLEIYAPIANRLGISWIKVLLEDLCLKHLHPDVYSKLSQLIKKTRKDREQYIDEVCKLLIEKLKDYDIDAEVQGRAKHFYSIYKKMERRKLDYEQLHDIIAFRIIVENITEVYKALGVIHALYKPVPGRIKDYIAMPKANSYQSLHTTVIGPYGERIEIQIRTEEMNLIAERGIAAHWRYKEGRFDTRSRENVEWVNRLLEWHKDLSDPNEFLETVKIDLFAEDVFVFTPRGEVKQLSHGATPLDFAYAVHTDVGHKCIGAKVNGKIVPLKHRLKSGDTVEILISSTQSPSKDWLKIVRSSKAKAKIRAFIKKQERERAAQLGRELLEKALRAFKVNLTRFEKSGDLLKVAKKLNRKTIDELLIVVGYGRVMADEIIPLIVPKDELEKFAKYAKEQPPQQDEGFLKRVFRSARKKSETKSAITVANLDDVLIRFGKCCNPLPGDSVIGFITRGRGVTVHTATCAKALDNDPDRRVDVKWNLQNFEHLHHARIRVVCLDEPGILATMTQAIATLGVNISSANIRTTKDKKAICIFDIEVKDISQLQNVTSRLEAKRGVISVERTRS